MRVCHLGKQTLIFIIYQISGYISQFHQITCSPQSLTLVPFEKLECEIPSMYNVQEYELFSMKINLAPAQIHAAVIALFAALVAPFGGFFASGLKRGLKIKDFSDSIPGHGGFADRFDCHIVCSFFVFIYLTQVVYKTTYSMERIFDYINALAEEDKQKIYQKLHSTYGNSTFSEYLEN